MPFARQLLGAAALTVFFAASAASQRDTVVRMAGAPRYSGTSTLVAEQTIGVVSGPDEYMFGDASSIALGRDGSVYVFDRSISGIRMYDRAGKHLRTFGRAGRGPGEFNGSATIAVLPDGRVVANDGGNRRINVYSATGTHLAQWAFATGDAGSSQGLVVDTAGFVYVRTTGKITVSPTKVLDVEQLWLRFRSRDGAIVDSIREPDWPPFVEPLIATRPAGGRAQMAMPFAPRRIATMSPLGYMVTGHPVRYAFEIRTAGRPVVSIRRDVPPTPVTAAERDSLRARLETRLKEADPLWTWGGRDIPRAKPSYADISVGPDGRIWILREASPFAPRKRQSTGRMGAGASGTIAFDGDDITERATKYDVYEPSGAYRGAVEIPVRVSPLVMIGDTVWAVARDDDDVQFVKRFRIVWK